MFFFFKQKTAYEMRISDWSSDVCSSDLEGVLHSGPHNLMYIDAFVGTSYEVQVLCGWLRLGLTAEFNAFDGLLNPISANLNSSTFVRSAFDTMIDETRFRAAGSRTLANTLM